MDDESTIKKCQNGEKDAFRFLVERYQKQAIAHAIAILGNREDARDALQEAFLDAFQAIKRFDNTRQFYPWFYVLLRNRCFKLVSQWKPTENIEEIEILAAAQPDSSREILLMLESALHELSSENREIVTLKYLDGLSYDELAERLEIPRGTVMSRLFYARKQLQTKLGRKVSLRKN